MRWLLAHALSVLPLGANSVQSDPRRTGRSPQDIRHAPDPLPTLEEVRADFCVALLAGPGTSAWAGLPGEQKAWQEERTAPLREAPKVKSLIVLDATQTAWVSRGPRPDWETGRTCGPEGPPARPVKGKSEVGCPCRGTGTLWEDAWASAASERDVLPCCFVLQRAPLKKPRAALGLPSQLGVLAQQLLTRHLLGG